MTVAWPALGGVHTSTYTNLEADQVVLITERAADDNVESFCPDDDDGAAPTQRFLAAVRTGAVGKHAACRTKAVLTTQCSQCFPIQALPATQTLLATTRVAE